MTKSADPTLPVIEDISSEISGSGSRSASFHAGLVEGTGPKLDTETQALLRVRLRALTLVFLVIWVVFFTRNFLFLEKKNFGYQLHGAHHNIVFSTGLATPKGSKNIFSNLLHSKKINFLFLLEVNIIIFGSQVK